MALLDALKSYLNPNGMQGLPMQLTPNAGIAKNIGGLLNAIMSAQPQYQQTALGQQRLKSEELENQNTPLLNALNNAFKQQQVQQLTTQNQFMPGMLQQDLTSKQINNQYLPQDMQSQIGLRNAQAQLAQRKVQNPFFGQMMSGPAGQIQGLELIRQQYGENSPQYQDAKKMFDTQLNQKQTMSDYYGSNLEYKNLTPAQKLELAKQKAEQSGDQAQVNTYDLAQLKYVSDPKNREAILKAKQMETTINAIDFPTISQYFGPQGRMKAAQDYSAAMSGNVSPEYDKYYRFITVQGPEVAKQLRQYFGDSIQPEAAKQYEKLITPDYWKSNPELAMKQFDEFVNLFKRDSAVRVGATTNPNIYKEQLELKQPIPKTNESGFSQTDLEHTAKLHNMTVEQVKQKLGIS